MQRSAYISHGMGLSLLATATRPRIADSVKGATSMYESTFLTERPAMRKRMIPGMKAQTVMRRSWRAERCEFCSGFSMMCDFFGSGGPDARGLVGGCDFDVQTR
jgi:hypothetical protein